MIGLLAGIVLPSIDVTRYRLDSGIQVVGTTLLASQRTAVTRQHDVIVTFDEANRRLVVHSDANNDGQVNGSEHRQVVALENAVVFGRGGAPALGFGGAPINFAETVNGLPAVIFHRNGSASSAGGLYLTSPHAAAGGATHARDTRALGMVRATGRAEWWRYNGSAWLRGF
jgi:hypothetical protein